MREIDGDVYVDRKPTYTTMDVIENGFRTNAGRPLIRLTAEASRAVVGDDIAASLSCRLPLGMAVELTGER